MRVKQKACRFDGTSWSEVEFPLSADIADWDESLRQAGYRVSRSIELQRGSYSISVHESVQEPGRFLVFMATRESMFTLIVEGFPALLQVLNQMIPIIRMGGETQEKPRRVDLE